MGNLLIKGSLIVLIGSTLANFGMYLFHLLMGRFLGPVDYGVLESLISLSYFLGIPMGVLGMVIVRFVSQESADTEKIAAFIKKIVLKISGWGFLALVVFLFAFPLLKNLIKVDSFALFLGLGTFSFISVYLTICSSSLQGIMQFTKLSLIGIFNIWSRLVLALIVVVLGFRVGGVLLATVLATLLTILLGYTFMAKYLPFASNREISISRTFTRIKSYSLAVFLNNLSTTSLYTVDIILARYFLSSTEAGYYAALSVLGKIIFFASGPIATVLFPLASEKQSKGEDYRRIILLGLGLVLLVSVGISGIYFLLPKLMINILYGQAYLSAAGNLGFFAIFISLYSLCVLFLNYYLSISKTKIISLALLAALVQIMLISIFHQSINQIIQVNIGVAFFLFMGLLLYFLRSP